MEFNLSGYHSLVSFLLAFELDYLVLITCLLALRSIPMHLCSSLLNRLEVCKLNLTDTLAKWLPYILLAGDPPGD